MKIFLIYKTDNHHSFASRDLIGVTASRRVVLSLCKKKAKLEGYPLSEDDISNLDRLSQTQGYAGDGEFHFESITVDKLL